MQETAVAAPIKNGPLASRGLRPATELAAGRPHGDRLRYIAGCRCEDCRRSNTQYERQRAAARRAGEWNGLVDAQRAREHLQALSRLGIGRRAVSDVADVSETIIQEILSGRKARIRARTERALLAVGEASAADRALVPAAETWRLLNELIEDGYTKALLARRLGCRKAHLQVGKHQVTVRTRHEVKRLYERLRFVDASESMRLLQELQLDGYRTTRIEREVAELASFWKLDEVPSLTPRRRRLHHTAVRLIEATYGRLTA